MWNCNSKKGFQKSICPFVQINRDLFWCKTVLINNVLSFPFLSRFWAWTVQCLNFHCILPHRNQILNSILSFVFKIKQIELGFVSCSEGCHESTIECWLLNCLLSKTFCKKNEIFHTYLGTYGIGHVTHSCKHL